MSAIKSGESCLAEFWCAEKALPEPALARLGSVQPIRHAKTASHAESPMTTADLNVRMGKRIADSVYPSIPQYNFFVTPDKFYKRSQEKNSFPAAGFLVGFQPTSWSRIVVAFRSVLSGRCAQLRSGFGFPCQRFSSLGRDEASLFGDHKQHGCQVPTMVLLGTRGP